MKLMGRVIDTLSPPALDTHTSMLLESSESRKGAMRGGSGHHRRSLSLGGSIDLSVQCDASAAVSGNAAAEDHSLPAVATMSSASSASLGLRTLAEDGSSAAEVAVEAAANFLVSTSPYLPQLVRCEMLLSLASCDLLQLPPVPSSHVAPLVDLLLPVTVQEFFLCFISDDHQFNTKVIKCFSILPSFKTYVILFLPNPHPSVSCCVEQPQHKQLALAGGRRRRPPRPPVVDF